MNFSSLNINFMKWRKPAAVLSILFMLIAVISLFVHSLNFGLEFTGGTLVEVSYPAAVELEPVRNLLENTGYKGARVQHFGGATEILVRIPPQDQLSAEDKNHLGQRVVAKLQSISQGAITLKRVEFIGPQVGAELKEQSSAAVLLALLCMFMFVSFRFKWKFAAGTLIALLHDTLVVVGIFSLFKLPFDLNVLAAVLAVIGYSLNDTIVVADRIRENFRLMPHENPITVINASLNQTLSRTMITSFLTFLSLVAFLVLGGEQLFGMSLALVLGIIVGTYSSIYVVAAFLLFMNVKSQDFLETSAQEIDDRP